MFPQSRNLARRQDTPQLPVLSFQFSVFSFQFSVSSSQRPVLSAQSLVFPETPPGGLDTLKMDKLNPCFAKEYPVYCV